MSIKKALQVFTARNHVFARSQEETSGFENPGQLATQLLEIPGVVQNLPAVDHLETCILERKMLTPRLGDGDHQPRVASQCPYGTGTDHVTGIGLQRGDLPTVASQGKGGNTSARTHIECSSRPASQQAPYRSPL